jgi:hypothetical protein
MRRLRLYGLQFASDGTRRQVEQNGPADMDMWQALYVLHETAFIMLDVIDLGPLQRYREMILYYHRRYGTVVWHPLPVGYEDEA